MALSSILLCLKHHSNHVAPQDKLQISVPAFKVLYMHSKLTSQNLSATVLVCVWGDPLSKSLSNKEPKVGGGLI